ncbi:MAG: T9SS type A sorting domain-containing protein [Chitinophagales bacterium]|nr:T9SS type A sorting domain-containing protein [Chitinophagales bacterium]
MKKILLTLSLAVLGATFASAQGSLLVVHNSPDPALANVDVWVEVPIASQYLKAVDNLTYQSGYFYTIPAVPIPGATLVVHLKSSTSTASSDPDLFSKTFSVIPTGNNIMIATGLATPSLLAAKTNPSGVSNAADLILINSGVQFSSSNPNQAQVALHHGIIDADSVYVQSFVTTIQAPARDVLVGKALYKDVTAHTGVAASARRIHIIPNGQAQTNPFYKANGDALRTLGGKAAFIVASGFADTTGTGTTNTAKVLAFVTDASTPGNSAITPVELPAEKLGGLTEIIHASADPLLKKIELYVNGVKQFLKLDYLQRFQSGAFIQDFHYDIDIHANDSLTKSLSVNLFLNDTARVGVIAGVSSTSGFTANPDGKSILANAYIDKPFVTTSPAGTGVVNVFHAATDAPTVSVTVPSAGGLSLISGLSYGQYQKANISGNTALPTSLGTVIVDLKLPGGAIYKSYLVPLGAIDGAGITLVATGFVDSAANKNGKKFGLYLAIPNGPLSFMSPLQDTVVSTSTSINDPSLADMQFRMFPNPASSEIVMAFDVKETSNVAIDILDMNGRVVKNVVNSTFGNKTVALTEDIRDLQNGLYIARVVSETKTSLYKFNVLK